MEKNNFNKLRMKTEIGLTEENRQSITNELSKILADESVLCLKTKNAHWNIEGVDFYEKHLLFDSLFKHLYILIDSVAERIRSIGHYAPASLKDFLRLTHLSEESREKNDSNGFMKELLQDHESVIINLRGNIETFSLSNTDFGTIDFITGIMETHEKMAWFLRSHLKN
jgi:starvation-inducible DNA-binding protein